MSDEDDMRKAMYDSHYDRQNDDDINTLIMMLIGIAVVLGAIVAGAGWLDSEFGWHLKPWITEHLHLGG